MIFPARPKPDLSKWHRRFAWWPIKLLDGRTAWLQEVEVKEHEAGYAYWLTLTYIVAREIGSDLEPVRRLESLWRWIEESEQRTRATIPPEIQVDIGYTE